MLDRRPKVLLVGEAPGFRGMRITGVPFTNRTMFEGPANGFGLFGPGKGYVLPADAAGVAAEPMATVMWEVLAELEFLPLLWSACPWHTHRPRAAAVQPHAQLRRSGPRDAVLAGADGQSPIETVVAVGNVAHPACSAAAWTCRRSGIPPTAAGQDSSGAAGAPGRRDGAVRPAAACLDRVRAGCPFRQRGFAGAGPGRCGH